MRSVECKNDNSTCLYRLIMSPNPYFTSVLLPGCTSATIQNILLDRIREQVNVECNMQE